VIGGIGAGRGRGLTPTPTLPHQAGLARASPQPLGFTFDPTVLRGAAQAATTTFQFAFRSASSDQPNNSGAPPASARAGGVSPLPGSEQAAPAVVSNLAPPASTEARPATPAREGQSIPAPAAAVSTGSSKVTWSSRVSGDPAASKR